MKTSGDVPIKCPEDVKVDMWIPLEEMKKVVQTLKEHRIKIGPPNGYITDEDFAKVIIDSINSMHKKRGDEMHQIYPDTIENKDDL